MRYTRFIAALVFSSALILSLVLSSSAAAYTDTLYCSYGVAYFAPLNSTAGKWVDYNPTVSSDETKFTFSSLPANLVSGNYEYSFDSFSFLLTPNNSYVEFENGYIYSYEFEIRSTKNTNPDMTGFQFGVCTEGFNDAIPLADVIYTYDKSGSTTINYYVSVTLNVDSSFPANSIPHPDEAFIYLRIATEWSDTFSLIASSMSVKKSVGEGAYYQASLDAIENLPNTEYDFTLNKMPDAEGTVEKIKGDADVMTEELNLQLVNLLGVFSGISGEEPLIYMPKMKIPILNLDLADYTEGYISQDGYFKPLSMIQDMDKSGQAMAGIELARKFIQITFVIGFATIGLEKMLKIEWWF